MFEDSKYRKILDISAIVLIVLLILQIIHLKQEKTDVSDLGNSRLSSYKADDSRIQKDGTFKQEGHKLPAVTMRKGSSGIEYTDYLKTQLSKKWSNVGADNLNGVSVYMIEVYPDGKLKSFAKAGQINSSQKYDKTIESIIINIFPLKSLPAEWRNEQVVFYVGFGSNGNVQVRKYRKEKASPEQIKRQYEINAMRKAQGFEEFPVKEFVYVGDNNIPTQGTLSGAQAEQVKKASVKKQEKQEKQITATSRILTGDELKLSKIRSSYVNYMEYCVRSNWKNPTGNNNYSLGLTFNIDKNGRITAYDVLRSSESAAFDKAAIQCLLNTAPFKPIPTELQMDGLNAQIYFNGVEVQVGATSKLKPTYRLTYDVDQTNKTCKTIEINQAKSLRTQSMYPSSAPQNLHWELGRQVQHNWNPPLNVNSSVCLKFRVLRTGKVQNIQFVTRSYNDAADMAAYNAIKNLKLSPFPLSSKSMYVDVKYWFYVENNKE